MKQLLKKSLAWEEISPATIRHSWRKLIPIEADLMKVDEEELSSSNNSDS